jgi:hypothetical protein
MVRRSLEQTIYVARSKDGSGASRLLNCGFESRWGRNNVCLLWMLRLFRKRSLRQTDPSSRGVLPWTIACVSLNVVRSNTNSLHLQWVGRRGHTKHILTTSNYILFMQYVLTVFLMNVRCVFCEVTETFYRMGHEKVARLPFCTCPCYCINFCIYGMLQTRVCSIP